MSSIGDGSARAIARLQERIKELEAENEALRKQVPEIDAALIDIEAVKRSGGVMSV